MMAHISSNDATPPTPNSSSSATAIATAPPTTRRGSGRRSSRASSTHVLMNGTVVGEVAHDDTTNRSDEVDADHRSSPVHLSATTTRITSPIDMSHGTIVMSPSRSHQTHDHKGESKRTGDESTMVDCEPNCRRDHTYNSPCTSSSSNDSNNGVIVLSLSAGVSASAVSSTSSSSPLSRKRKAVSGPPRAPSSPRGSRPLDIIHESDDEGSDDHIIDNQLSSSFETPLSKLRRLNSKTPVHASSPSAPSVASSSSPAKKKSSKSPKVVEKKSGSDKKKQATAIPASPASPSPTSPEAYLASLKPTKKHANQADIRADKLHACHLCDKKYIHRHTLKRHLRSHDDSLLLQCNLCEKTFSRSDRLKGHMRTHTGEKPFACEFPGCGKAFRDRSNWKRHQRMHRDGRGRTNRSVTPSPIATPRSLSSSTSTTPKASASSSSSSTAMYECDTCDKQFHTITELKRHQKTHKDDSDSDGDYKTDDDSDDSDTSTNSDSSGASKKKSKKTTAARTAAPKNQSSKSSAATLKAATTPKGTSASTAAIHGVNSATGMTNATTNEALPFVCPQPGCGERFKYQRNISDHVRDNHADERVFACGTCDRSFNHGSSLKRHLRAYSHQLPAPGDDGKRRKKGAPVAGPAPSVVAQMAANAAAAAARRQKKAAATGGDVNPSSSLMFTATGEVVEEIICMHNDDANVDGDIIPVDIVDDDAALYPYSSEDDLSCVSPLTITHEIENNSVDDEDIEATVNSPHTNNANDQDIVATVTVPTTGVPVSSSSSTQGVLQSVAMDEIFNLLPPPHLMMSQSIHHPFPDHLLQHQPPAIIGSHQAQPQPQPPSFTNSGNGYYYPQTLAVASALGFTIDTPVSTSTASTTSSMTSMSPAPTSPYCGDHVSLAAPSPLLPPPALAVGGGGESSGHQHHHHHHHHTMTPMTPAAPMPSLVGTDSNGTNGMASMSWPFGVMLQANALSSYPLFPLPY